MIGFVWRFAAALALVLATYNPTPWNFLRWALDDWAGNLPVLVLCGLVLLIGYIIYFRATLRSIGPFGIVLVAALIGALLWVLADFGWLNVEDQTVMEWIGLVALALILAIGLSWSLVRRHLTGQADMDDVDE